MIYNINVSLIGFGFNGELWKGIFEVVNVNLYMENKKNNKSEIFKKNIGTFIKDFLLKLKDGSREVW